MQGGAGGQRSPASRTGAVSCGPVSGTVTVVTAAVAELRARRVTNVLRWK